MKRFIIFLLLIFFSVTFAFAEFSAGLFAGGIFPLGSQFPYYKQKSIDSYIAAGNPVKTKFYSGSDVTVFFRYGLPVENPYISPLGIQTEVSFFTKNGLMYRIDFPDETDEDKKVRSESHIYSSLEWSLLASYDYNFGPFSLNALAGLNMSFPLKIHYSSDETERTGQNVTKKTSSPLVFGAAFGLSAFFNINRHNAVSFDLRYLLDTMTMNVNDVFNLTRHEHHSHLFLSV